MREVPDTCEARETNTGKFHVVGEQLAALLSPWVPLTHQLPLDHIKNNWTIKHFLLSMYAPLKEKSCLCPLCDFIITSTERQSFLHVT